MKYCSKCGQQLPDSARFCSKCGAPQPFTKATQAQQAQAQQAPAPKVEEVKPEVVVETPKEDPRIARCRNAKGQITPTLFLRMIYCAASTFYVLFMAILKMFFQLPMFTSLFSLFFIALSTVINIVGLVRSIRFKSPFRDILLTAVFLAFSPVNFVASIIILSSL
ncbi:MAG: zinc ribbon domain-containing protein [Bacilli bacterium]|nr:zinc ribbon domain-containing protein [Bacilli bacterium]